jgi:cyclase
MGFHDYKIQGRPRFTLERFIDWDVDEIVFLDMSATPEERIAMLDVISAFSRKCFIPLTIGGGIKTTKDIKEVLRAGADKVCINTSAVHNPEFITKASEMFGVQCIVVSIDVKRTEKGYEVITACGKEATGMDPVEWAKKAEELGAGEIFLTSIDMDGSKQGYDIELIRNVSDAVSIPVIACGGVGCMEDFVKGIKDGHASAVSASNIFHYTEHSTIKAKATMRNAGIDVRISTEATYLERGHLKKLEIN